MFALVLLALGGLAIGFASRKKPPTVIRGIPRPSQPSPHRYLAALSKLAREKKPAPRWLVDEAVREAFELGDWQAVAKLASAFPLSPPRVEETPDERISDTSPSTEEASTGEDAPPMDASIVIGKNSPIEGVSNDDWNEFVEKLKTQNASYDAGKFVGMFHQNKERLSQLDIDPATLSTEAAQYAALEKDIKQHHAEGAKLINEFGGELIDIDGACHPVSMSGVLGVLKAAGAKHARSWFKNPDEREKFKHTTETFLRTNNLF